MGSETHPDEVVVPPAVAGGHHLVELFLPGAEALQLVFLDHRSSDHATQPHIGCALGHGITVKVHLDRGGDAVAQQLGATDLHADPDIVGCELSFAGPHHLVQPAVDREAFTRATKEHHRGVTVGVDHARHQESVDVMECRFGSVGCVARRS